jgi:glutathione S-transferase
MLKLYGFSVSNYYNMVKLALLEKGLSFEEVPFFSGQTPMSLR